MSDVVIKVENVSKQYRLGSVGTGTISHDLNRWWAKVRGKEDPFLKIGEANDRTKRAASDLVWALKDINFEVKQGEVLGIIGRNGAGKSTLLKILSRVTAPTLGNIKAKGRIASLLEVGTGFHPELTGRENIFLNGAILGMSKQEIKSKFDEIVSFSGVERYIDTPVKRYSSGMYVRLAFAVAAHLEPEILIVDEVLAVGDAEFQKKCLGKMKDVSGQGRTVLFVSHNMAAVKSLCTQGIILRNGILDFSGDAENACSNYLGKSMQEAEVHLMDRMDRVGNGNLVIEDVYFQNLAGENINSLISGEYVKIVFKYKKNITKSIHPLFIGVTIKNDSEITQTVIATDELGINLTCDKSNGVIEVIISQLLLRGGNYSLTYMVSEKKSVVASHDILDKIDNAVFFEVEKGDFWKTGNINRPSSSGFLQNSSILIK
ncbi:MAG: ABC transporter ATP-binding protein [Bacteroidetes bacterium]|nr:ABC transporter ATP-binding protein [Bacteroidota bacterium]